MENKKFIDEIQHLGRKLQEDIEASKENRTTTQNPQTLFKKFKDSIIPIAKKASKIAASKKNHEIKILQKDLTQTLNEPNADPEEKLITSAIIQEKIDSIETQRHLNACAQTAVRNRLEGETISKYWSQINKTRAPRDTILSLKIPNTNPPAYEKNSTKMAEIARNYHDQLQLQGLATEPDQARATEKALNTITEKTPQADKIILKTLLTEEEVLRALSASPSGKAAGMDGIPYKLWKALHNKFLNKEHYPTNKKPVNIIKVLTAVYNDIEINGVDENSKFSFGWMCPIYKKKDTREISNYRPITILNTDYKTFTKALNSKLSKIATKVLHEDQAGFLSGRSIHDQIKLSKLIIDYAEATEENGAIIALDQEKAYDKISHDYLWKVLKKFQLPNHFIRIIQSIYKTAETVIIINGEISSSYKVTRGVRQGDPLSCILFDLAIEPLAAML